MSIYDKSVEFKRKIIDFGTSKCFTLPPELINFLELKKGDNVYITAEVGRHGPFLAVYTKKTKNESSTKSSR